jgi:uncharacterized membrane protein YfcA
VLTALAGALAIGLSLGLLGSGGSILTVPVLHYLLGQPEQVAIGGQVSWPDVLWFGLPGMAGAWIGATLARWIPGTAQLSIFALAMLVAAWRMVSATAPAPSAPGSKTHRLAVVTGGMGVGLLSGVVGVGGGFLIVPALVVLGRVPMAQAVGTSLAIITVNSFTGLARYLDLLGAQGVNLDWRILALVAAVGIAGSLLGHRLGRRLPQQLLRRIFGIVLVVLAGVISIDLASRLG